MPPVQAAVCAMTPRWLAPNMTNGWSRPAASPASGPGTMRPALRPARFHALEADVTVMPRSAPGMVRYGVKEPGSYTRAAWISSEMTVTPWSSASRASVWSSADVCTVPVGLCGLDSRYAARAPPIVARANASSRDSGSRRPSGVSGASRGLRPIESMTVKKAL